MRRTQTAVIATAVAIVLAVGAVVAWQRLQEDDDRDYPGSVRDNFLVSCAEGGSGAASDEECRCTLEEIEDRLSFEGYTDAELEIARGGDIHPAFTEALAICADEEPALVEDALEDSADDVIDELGPDAPFSRDTLSVVEADPVAGRWSTTDEDRCAYLLVEGDGHEVNSVSSSLTVPAGATELRFSPDCTWAPDTGT